MSKLNQRGVIHLFIPLILLAGLIAAVYLVTSGNPLKLFSQAANPPIVFKSFDGKALSLNSNGVYQTTSPYVRVEATSTLGPPASVSGPIKSSTTVAYRAGFSPTEVHVAAFIPYIVEPTVYGVRLKNTQDVQYYWVEFKGADGKLDRRAAKIQLISGSVSGPITTITKKCLPRPVCLDAKPACKIPEPVGGWCVPNPSQTTLPVACVDLALKRPVTSSGYWASGSPDKAVDGMDSTAWQTNQSSGAWISVDLGAINEISQVQLIWFWDSRFGSYATSTIQVISTDDRNWRDVAKSMHTKTTNNRQKEILNFAPVRTRYVRFYGNQWNGGWADMQDFEVYGKGCTSIR